jgi:hypothetical protein
MTRRRARALVASCVAAAVLAPSAAWAEPRTALRDGRVLRVAKATGLSVDGDRVRVRGEGYDWNTGILVAFCVDNGDLELPGPCAGEVGAPGGTAWISDRPPAAFARLARPFSPGGSFDVTLAVKAQLDATTDCLRVRCAIVTRADDFHPGDRSQTLVVPVTFGLRRAPVGEAAAPVVAASVAATPVRRAASGTPAAERDRVAVVLLAGVLLASAAGAVGGAAQRLVRDGGHSTA